ncbi:ABC transporter substrate-binding protein [Heliorestis convoluta]|uniref:Branched-chain amino acid ABC transporter substrate-binding protein n=1 Tax=Heliorestis convoluta TaxID=356322 RepID=A0A5Q2N2B8_9FIRM|nr:ABC transporter substrate-binding protein [Heliorestis convoluta]QGG47422.1 branched-chain amino acid ABC transporter substrate-binding protein [Heliorestis convoluta]
MLTKSKKGIFATLAVLTLVTATALTGCGDGASTSSSGDTIQIGALVDKSGKGADWGRKNEIAMNIAVEEINASGGINGSPIELLVRDTNGRNEEAVNLTRSLAGQGVAAIVGPFFSGECEVAFPQANQLQVPIISPSSAKAGISENNRPWAFRNSMTDDKLLREATPRFVKAFDVKTVVVLHDERDAWSKAVGTDDLPREFKAAGVEILNEGNYFSFNTGETNFSAIVTQVRNLNPDAIAFGGLYNEAAAFAREMERQGLKIPVLGGVGMYAGALIQQGGTAVENFVATSSWNVDSEDEQARSFVEKFKPQAAQITPADPLPGSFEANHYETIYMIAHVLEQAGVDHTTPTEEVRLALRDGFANLKDFKGITGLTSIDEKGDGIKTIYPLVVREGRFEILE